jgi:hypothetical protein
VSNKSSNVKRRAVGDESFIKCYNAIYGYPIERGTHRSHSRHVVCLGKSPDSEFEGKRDDTLQDDEDSREKSRNSKAGRHLGFASYITLHFSYMMTLYE